MKYKFTQAMREISGFGGKYEKACRKMVLAGVKWLDAHPDTDPKFHGFKNVYGIIAEDNDDAKALSEAVVSACDDHSGAMHTATIAHVLHIKNVGWDNYVREMKKKTILERIRNRLFRHIPPARA